MSNRYRRYNPDEVETFKRQNTYKANQELMDAYKLNYNYYTPKKPSEFTEVERDEIEEKGCYVLNYGYETVFVFRSIDELEDFKGIVESGIMGVYDFCNILTFRDSNKQVPIIDVDLVSDKPIRIEEDNTTLMYYRDRILEWLQVLRDGVNINEIIICRSSGKDSLKSENKQKATYKYSYHLIIRGLGWVTVSKNKEMVQDLKEYLLSKYPDEKERIEAIDESIYKGCQNMRMKDSYKVLDFLNQNKRAMHSENTLRTTIHTYIEGENEWKYESKGKKNNLKLVRKESPSQEPLKELSDKEKAEVKSLIDCLQLDKRKDYHFYYKLGLCMKTLNYFEGWDYFCSKYPEYYNREKLLLEWDKMECRVEGEKRLTKGSLIMWAKEDKEVITVSELNKTKIVKDKKVKKPKGITDTVGEIQEDNLEEDSSEDSEESTEESSEEGVDRITDDYLAMIGYNSLKSRFIFSEETREFWYLNKYNRWEKDLNGKELRNCLREVLRNARKGDTYTTQEKKKIKKMIESKNMRAGIIETMKDLIGQKELMDKLDGKRNLIGFNNGVFDLDTGGFRLGRYDDYVSMTTKYDYGVRNPIMEKEIMDFWSQIFMSVEERDYYLTLLASCLDGNNKDQLFVIESGRGSNGKSICDDLIMRTLGEYGGSMDSTLLVALSRDGNAPCPGLMNVAKCRYVSTTEPNASNGKHKNYFNCGLIKKLSGEDSVPLRNLYQSEIKSYKFKFKVFLLCNEIPAIIDNSDGMSRRIVNLKFKSRFCDNPQKPNEFKVDETLSYKFDNWKVSFIHILLDYHSKYINLRVNSQNLRSIMPESIKANGYDLIYGYDSIRKWYEEEIEETTDQESYITLKEGYVRYHDWYEDNKNTYGFEEIESKMVFKTRITLWLGSEPKVKTRIKNPITGEESQICNYWRGYKISIPQQ